MHRTELLHTLSDYASGCQISKYFSHKANNDQNKPKDLNHPNHLNNPLKGFLKGSDVPANPGGSAVGTVGGVVAFIELGHKTAYLFV
jgi:hypothetical protein